MVRSSPSCLNYPEAHNAPDNGTPTGHYRRGDVLSSEPLPAPFSIIRVDRQVGYVGRPHATPVNRIIACTLPTTEEYACAEQALLVYRVDHE